MISGTGKNKNSTAFTFVELFLVVIVIGILVSVSFPKFRNTFNSLEFDNFTSRLQNFIGYLSQRSVVEGKPVIMKFDAHDSRLKASMEEDCKVLADLPVPGGIKVELEEGQVVFYPDSSIGKADILLSNKENRSVLTTRGVFGGAKNKGE